MDETPDNLSISKWSTLNEYTYKQNLLDSAHWTHTHTHIFTRGINICKYICINN